MGELKCLICYNGVDDNPSPPSEPQEGLGGARDMVVDELSPGESEQRESKEKQVFEELETVFLVRTILEVPQEQVVGYLEKWGSPSEWFQFCGRCGEAVNNVKNIYKKILNTRKMLRSVKRDFVEMLKESVGGGKGDDETVGGIMEVTVKTRQFVGKHEYEIEVDPFFLNEDLIVEMLHRRLGESEKMDGGEDDDVQIMDFEQEFKDVEVVDLVEENAADSNEKLEQVLEEDEPPVLTALKPNRECDSMEPQISKPDDSDDNLQGPILEEPFATSETPCIQNNRTERNDEEISSAQANTKEDDKCKDPLEGIQDTAASEIITPSEAPENVVPASKDGNKMEEDPVDVLTEGTISNLNKDVPVVTPMSSEIKDSLNNVQLDATKSDSSQKEAAVAMDESQVCTEKTSQLSKMVLEITDADTVKENMEELPKIDTDKSSKVNPAISPVKIEISREAKGHMCSADPSLSSPLKVDPLPVSSAELPLAIKQEKDIKKEKIDVSSIKTEANIKTEAGVPNELNIKKEKEIKTEPNIKKESEDGVSNTPDKSIKSIHLSFNIPKLTLIKAPPPKISEKPVKSETTILQDCNISLAKSLSSAQAVGPNSCNSPPLVDLSTSDEPLVLAKVASETFSSSNSFPSSLPPPTTAALPSFSDLMSPAAPGGSSINPPINQNLLGDLDPFLQDILSVPASFQQQPGAPSNLPVSLLSNGPSTSAAPKTPYTRPLFTSDLRLPHGRQGQVLGANGHYQFLCMCGKTYATNGRRNAHLRQIKERLNALQNPGAASQSPYNIVQGAVQELKTLQNSVANIPSSQNSENYNSNLLRKIGQQKQSQPEFPKTPQEIVKQGFKTFTQDLQRLANRQPAMRPVRTPQKLQRVARAHFTPRSPPKMQQLVAAAKQHLTQRSPQKLQKIAKAHFTSRLGLPNPLTPPKRQLAPRLPKHPPPPQQKQLQRLPPQGPSPVQEASFTSKPYLNAAGYFCEQCLSSYENGGSDNRVLTRFRYLCDLENHIKSMHGGWFKCTTPLCPRQFRSYTELDVHMESGHEESRTIHAFSTSQAQVLQTAPIKIPTIKVARKKTSGGLQPLSYMGKISMPRPGPHSRRMLPGMGARQVASATTKRKEEEIVCIQLDD